MKCLVDTQSLIWFVDQDHYLSRPAHAVISDSENTLLISAASIWEIAIKVGFGKLALSMPYRNWMESAIHDLGLDLLPITVEFAHIQAVLPWHHRDPFDRLIIAQAITLDIPVISSDAIFDDYGIRSIW